MARDEGIKKPQEEEYLHACSRCGYDDGNGSRHGSSSNAPRETDAIRDRGGGSGQRMAQQTAPHRLRRQVREKMASDSRGVEKKSYEVKRVPSSMDTLHFERGSA